MISAAGVCLLLAAFALVAARGGWNRAIGAPMSEAHWPVQRWLMALGAGVTMLSMLMLQITVASLGVPWQ
jgi:hypothetical protein